MAEVIKHGVIRDPAYFTFIEKNADKIKARDPKVLVEMIVGSCRIKADVVSKDEIEKGISAVQWAVGGPVAPYFRFPGLRQPPDLLAYLAQRNIAVFSTDVDSFDFKLHNPEKLRQSVLAKLKKQGKGIILMHDFQQATAHAAPELLKRLKDGGYKVVQVVGKTPVEPKKEYVDMVLKEIGGGMETARPMSSVIKDISN